MSFKYLYIPADDKEPVVQLEASKSGGLENDLLRKQAEIEFSKSGINREEQRVALASQLAEKGIDAKNIEEMLSNQLSDRAVGSVEIITLSLPTPQNNYMSISLYCDGNSAFKVGGKIPNARATAIVQACGHQNTVVMGNCFIGKAMDDERVAWERSDFLLEELDVNARWVRVAAQANAGKDLGRYSTSGTLSAMHEAQKGKAQPVVKAAVDEPEVQSEFSASQLFVWTQTAEEVEVRMRLPAGLLSKHINVTFTSSTLYIGRKNAKSSADAAIETVDSRWSAADAGGNPAGAKLGGAINASESTWSIAEEKEGRCLTLNLAKSSKATWKHLLL